MTLADWLSGFNESLIYHLDPWRLSGSHALELCSTVLERTARLAALKQDEHKKPITLRCLRVVRQMKVGWISYYQGLVMTISFFSGIDPNFFFPCHDSWNKKCRQSSPSPGFVFLFLLAMIHVLLNAEGLIRSKLGETRRKFESFCQKTVKTDQPKATLRQTCSLLSLIDTVPS